MNRKERRAQQSKTRHAVHAPGSNVDFETVSAYAIGEYRKGNLAEAEQGFRRACELAPQTAAAAFNLGHVLDLRGARAEAIVQYRRALSIRPDYVEAWFNLSSTLRQHGDIAGAIEACHRVLQLKPDLPQAHNNLGNLLLTQNRLDEARQAYSAAVAQQPDYIEAHYNLACCLHKQEKTSEAMAAFTQALQVAPRDADIHHGLGVLLQARGEHGRAEQSLRRAVELNNRHSSAWYELGNALQMQQRDAEAVDAYRYSLQLQLHNVPCHNNLGLSLDRLGRAAEAETAFRKAISLKSDYAEAHANLGNCLAGQGRMAEAEAAYRDSLAVQADSPATHNNLGILLAAKGELAAAESAYRRALELDPQFTEAYRNIATLKKVTSPQSDDIRRMELAYTSGKLSDLQTMHLCFGLGKAFDDCDEFDKAFVYYEKANRLKRAVTTFDIGHFRSHVDRIVELFGVNVFSRVTARGANDATPVFIVGMPRSGTTLVEQIIAGHPQVHGAGELTGINDIIYRLENPPRKPARTYPECVDNLEPDEIESAANDYLRLLRLNLGDAKDAIRITDKMPFNFLHLGLIALLFPNAGIVHCRRDALDTCLSNFFQYFPRGAEYSYGMEDTAMYYKEYERLMKHWHEVLPIKILDIQYEEILDDIESESRKLTGYLGLDWDDACLRFHQLKRPVRTLSAGQVRQPLYTRSRERWRNYTRLIGPLIGALGRKFEIERPSG